MGEVDRIWAGWRSEYVSKPRGDNDECVFCALLASDLPDNETFVVARNDQVAAILNAYPYGTGHLLVMPVRHVGDIDEMSDAENVAVWKGVSDAVKAIRAAYGSPGLNIGLNLGTAAGAGIPEHLHVHALPRWGADTNFITAVANTRVLPEALDVTWKKLTEAWPS